MAGKVKSSKPKVEFLIESEDESRRLTRTQKAGQEQIYENLLSGLEEFEISYLYPTIVDPSYIRRASVVSITRTLAEVQKTQEQSYTNSVKDPKMGPTLKSRICSTCAMDEGRCPGHNGSIEFAEMIYMVAYMKEIIKVLTCICRDCGKLLLSEAELKENQRYTLVIGIDRLMRVAETSAKITCMREECLNSERIYEGEIDEKKSTELFRIQIKRENEHKEIPIERVYRLFRKLSDADYGLLGYRIERNSPNDMTSAERQKAVEEGNENGVPRTTHPKNFIMRNIFVPPNRQRQDKVIKGQRQLSDLTVLYDQIVGNNIIIADLKQRLEDAKRRSIDDTNTMKLNSTYQKQVSDMTIRVHQILDAEKYKTGMSRNTRLKGAHQELQGKKAKLRSHAMAKVTDYVIRHVAGPDPFLEFGEGSIPASSAYKQTQREKVFSGNLIACTKLLRRGDVIFYEREGGIKIEVTPEFAKSGRLEIGMTVYRRSMNGDIVVNNRFPSIQMYSIGAVTMRVWKHSTIGAHMAETTAKKLDFDGDEMQAHFLQTYAAQADAIASVHVRRNIINVQNSMPLAAGVYNVPVATTLLSQPGVTVSESDYSNILTRLVSQDQIPSLYSRLTRHHQPITIVFDKKSVPRHSVLYYLFLVATNPLPFITPDEARNAFIDWLRDEKVDLIVTDEDFKYSIEPYFGLPSTTYSHFLGAQRHVEGGQTIFETTEHAFEVFKEWFISIENSPFEALQEAEDLAQFTETQLRGMSDQDRSEMEIRFAYMNRILSANLLHISNLVKDANVPVFHSLDDLQKKLADPGFQEQLAEARKTFEMRKIRADNLTLEIFERDYLPGYNRKEGLFRLFVDTNIISHLSDQIPLDDPLTIENAYLALKEWLFRRNLDEESMPSQETLIDYLRSRYGEPISKTRYAEIARQALEEDLKKKDKMIQDLIAKRQKQYAKLENGVFKDRKRLQIEDLQGIEKRVALAAKNRRAELERRLAAMAPLTSIWLGLGLKAEDQVEIRYPGRVLLSLIMPAGLSYSEFGVTIREGVVIDGIFTADVVGTNKNSLIQAIFSNYGSERAADFITDLYFMSYSIYTPLNMTISLSDLSETDPVAVLAIEEEKANLMKRVNALGATLPQTTDPLISEKYEREMLQLTRDFANIGAKVTKALNQAGNIARIIQSKAKGKPADFSRMLIDLQQATLSGQRIPMRLANNTRTLSYYAIGENSLESRGFISSSYVKSLEPDEYYTHSLSSRPGIVDTQLITPFAGDDHRKLVKSCEDLRLNQANSIVNQTSGIRISMLFGNHSLNPTHLRIIRYRGGIIASPFYPKEMLASINAFYGTVPS